MEPRLHRIIFVWYPTSADELKFTNVGDEVTSSSRVSSKNIHIQIFLISWPLKGLGISSWNFSTDYSNDPTHNKGKLGLARA